MTAGVEARALETVSEGREFPPLALWSNIARAPDGDHGTHELIRGSSAVVADASEFSTLDRRLATLRNSRIADFLIATFFSTLSLARRRHDPRLSSKLYMRHAIQLCPSGFGSVTWRSSDKMQLTQIRCRVLIALEG